MKRLYHEFSKKTVGIFNGQLCAGGYKVIKVWQSILDKNIFWLATDEYYYNGRKIYSGLRVDRRGEDELESWDACEMDDLFIQEIPEKEFPSLSFY